MNRLEWFSTSRMLGIMTLGAALWVGQGCDGSDVTLAEPDSGVVSSAVPESDAGVPESDAGAVANSDATLPADGDTLSPNHCLAGITNFDKPGPFTYTSQYKGLVKIWVPKVPKGCKVPMVHLSNGTGAFCNIYKESLDRLASHGFLALCFEVPLTGTGDPGMIAFETALKAFPDLADYRFGSTGHSQGGQAALVTLQYAEARWGSKGRYAGLAMQPASGFGLQPLTGLWPMIYNKIKSPVFMFSGLITDGLVPTPWVTAAYLALNNKTEAYHWMRILSTHIPVPNFEEQQISVAWFRWKLLGDTKACEHFKAIPKKDIRWIVRAQQNVASCN